MGRSATDFRSKRAKRTAKAAKTEGREGPPLRSGELVYSHLFERIARVHEASDETVVFTIDNELIAGGAELFSETSSRLRTPNLLELFQRRWSDGLSGVCDELLSLTDLDRIRACARYACTGPMRKAGQKDWQSVKIRELERIWLETTGGQKPAWLPSALAALEAEPQDDLRCGASDDVVIATAATPSLLNRVLDPPPSGGAWEPERLMYSATYSGRSLLRVAKVGDAYSAREEALLLQAISFVRSCRKKAEEEARKQETGEETRPKTRPLQLAYGHVRRLLFATFFNALRKRLLQKLKDGAGDFPAAEILDDVRNYLWVTDTSRAEFVRQCEAEAKAKARSKPAKKKTKGKAKKEKRLATEKELLAWLDDDESLTHAAVQACAEVAASVIDDPDREPRNVKRFVWSADVHLKDPREAGLSMADRCCDDLVEQFVSETPKPAVQRLVAALEGRPVDDRTPSALITAALSAMVDRLIELGHLFPASRKERSAQELSISTGGEIKGGKFPELDRTHAPTHKKLAYDPAQNEEATAEFARFSKRTLESQGHFKQRNPRHSEATPDGSPQRRRTKDHIRAIRVRFARQVLRSGYESTPTNKRELKAQKGVRVIMAMTATRMPRAKLLRVIDGPEESTVTGWFKSPPRHLLECFPPEIRLEYSSEYTSAHAWLRDQLSPSRTELSQVLRNDSLERLEAISYLFFEAELDGQGTWIPKAMKKAAAQIGTDDAGLTRFVIATVRKIQELRRGTAARRKVR